MVIKGGNGMVFASNNPNKLKEIRMIFKEEEILSLKDCHVDIDVIEDQGTFYGNALKKAKEIYEIVKQPVIADDSGLEILALNRWPGVNTHRFLGDDATDKDRNLAIIKKLENITDRRAEAKCVLVYYDGHNTCSAEGIIKGNITYECRGKRPFGFDEIFELDNGKTLAELSLEEKNKISQRAEAAKGLKRKLERL